jgi:hypothetical protein
MSPPLFGAPLHIDDKIVTQLVVRGWTEQDIRNAAAGTSTDNTNGRAEPATVYGSRTGGYVVVNDIANRVVQISYRTDPGWLPDSRITWI